MKIRLHTYSSYRAVFQSESVSTDGAYLGYTQGDAHENPKPEKGGNTVRGERTQGRKENPGEENPGEETPPKKMPARSADTRPV